ncbi:MAG: protein kinase, partial [Gammaproteobacteria bacterium]|nr:protein kinase [Gemmatimonadota bacterium]NIU78972.1 protein kinase [Gammaproteobacteria bacterium]NIX24571.1 protein kinase [Actinomycetota bacterium]
GEFEILDELGSGGMGTVFLAREIALDREVALKVLPPAFLIHPNLRERFKREARLAARLDHPGITPVYRVVETEDLIYYTMKYVRGRSLKELLKDQGPQPLDRIRKILIECA